MKGGKIYFVASILLSLVISQDSLFAQTASWRITTSAVPWVDSGSRASTAWAATTNYIELFPDTLYQTIQGFGGCFSDKGWDAMTKVSALQQDSVIRALFDTSGCNFNDCRLPIGASDFADGHYSLDDSSGDYAMTHFNLTHDSTRIIPFIKAGMVYQPNLVVWGSPWTPPEWMKTTGTYSGAGTLKQDTQTLDAYSLYLEKAVRAFKAKGITISALTAQNEPTQGAGQNYPSCVWSNTQFMNFYQNYLIPRFLRDTVNVKLMLGTYCCGDSLNWIITPMADTAIANHIALFGLQHTELGWEPIARTYPKVTIYETETDCCHADNWAGGVEEFDLLASFLNGGASVYSEWNMVLDQTRESGWNWPGGQATMITVDTTKKTITYQAEYYAARQWSYYIKQNARRIKLNNSDASYKGSTSAYLNPDGSIILMASNEATGAYALTVKLGNTKIAASLPASSLNTFRILGATPVKSVFAGNQVSSIVTNVHVRNGALLFSVPSAGLIHEIEFSLSDLKGAAVWSALLAGSDLHGEGVQSVAMRPRGGIPSGTYLLDMRIKGAGVGSGRSGSYRNKVLIY